MKKRLLAVLLTAAMVLGMTACGSKSNSGSSDKKEEAQSTDDIKECTIKFQYWADNTDYSSLMQDIIKKFNEENEYGTLLKVKKFLGMVEDIPTHCSTQLWVVEHRM